MSDQELSLAEALTQAMIDYRDRVAFYTEDRPITFVEVRQIATCFALHMQRLGIDRSSTVALRIKAEPVAMAAIVAVAWLGARWVEGTPKTMSSEAARVTHVLHTERDVNSDDPRIAMIDGSWSAPPPGVTDLRSITFPGPASQDDIWSFSLSSGTTGLPKLMPGSYALALTRTQSITAVVKYDPRPVVCIFPPLKFNYVGFWLGLFLRGEPMALGLNIENWKRWNVKQVNAPPSRLVELLPRLDAAGLRFETLNLGGSKVTDRQMGECLKYFDQVAIGYGSNEAGAIARWWHRLVDGTPQVVKFGVVPGVEIEIVDELDHVVPKGAEGRIRIRTPFMITGYAGDEEANQQAFKDGWFYPGDLARWEADETLTIIGRYTDVFNFSGIKLGATVLDDFIEQAEGVAQAISFAVQDDTGLDRLAVAVVASPGADPAQVAANVRESTGRFGSAFFVPLHVYFVDELPFTDTGKPQRRLCPELCADKESW